MNIKGIITLLLASSISGSIFAQETPRWIRNNSISPDGTRIAFCYKGDIYVVPTNGGKATQITSNKAYDGDPLWTKDSKNIVFSSYREGSKDIFITSAEGGTPKRITDIPGNETPKAILEDGRILYTANFQQDAEYAGFPGSRESQLYIISQEGGIPERLSSLTMSEISISKDGKILYEDYKGYEDPFRKHHRSSVTKDIWLYTGGAAGEKIKGTFKKVSDFYGEDRQPIFASDGQTFYYLSERGNDCLNIFRSDINSPSNPIQITNFTQNPVRYISISDNGILAFSQNGDLYTLRSGGQPQKVDITIYRDESEKEITKLNFSGSASSMDVSPNGKEIAIVIRGDVFVTSIDYKTTRRITNTPQQERNVSFGEDGKSLYYSSERDGHWGIYRTVLTEESDKYFTYAVKTKEELFSDEGETCFQPVVSPDGKYVAYLRDRTEIVIKPTKGGKAKSLLKGVNYSYTDGDQHFSWSPDSHFLLCNYIGDGGWHNGDVAMINIDNGEVTDLTESGYSDGDARWALKGKAMTWTSDKYGYRSHGSWGAEDDVYIMFFDAKRMSEFKRDKEDEELAKLQENKDEKKEEIKDTTAKDMVKRLHPDLEGRENRIIRLTQSPARLGDHYLSEDGKKLYYITPLEKGRGLCEMDIQEKSVKVLMRDVFGRIIPSRDGKFIYLAGGGGITQIAIPSGQQKRIAFTGEYEFKPQEEREYIFDHTWKQVKEKFYDPNLHGVDWDYYKENYSQFLPYINNYYDFQEMLSEMLGELNGSHTGARYRAPGGERMGCLGVIYDLDYKGDGIKIKEVLPDGVLSLANPDIKDGDIITAIEGHEIKAGDNWMKLLEGKAGKKIAISLKKHGEILVKPSTSDANLLYRRWVKRNEDKVKELSDGKIGYVHVQGMDSESFREVYSKALGKYRNCDALIVDTRHNGGGWLHDDLATFLNGKAYAEFRPRGQYIGTEPFNKWTKPSCVLVCEDNYSDASGFPYVYKTLGIGKIIGTSIPGTMTAVWWETQVNGTIIFGIPQVGTFGLKEQRYLENLPVEPDITVFNTPGTLLEGRDIQLEEAVKEMLKANNK